MIATSSLTMVNLALLALVRAAPVTSRAGEIPTPRSFENINFADLSTPVLLEHSFDGEFLDGVPVIHDGNITVLGLNLDSNLDGIAKQIACMNDVCVHSMTPLISLFIASPRVPYAGTQATALRTAVKQQFCEAENFNFVFKKLNDDEPASDPVNDCSPNKDGKTPFACIVNDDPDFSPNENFVDTDPSPFEIDNDAGHTLSVTNKGPIGIGYTTSVEDNGNSTFTVAGNLTTFSKALALQVGCLFDEAACNSDPKGKDCTAQRLKCQTDNKLNSRVVIFSQTTTNTRFPDGIDVDPPTSPINLIFRRLALVQRYMKGDIPVY